MMHGIVILFKIVENVDFVDERDRVSNENNEINENNVLTRERSFNK